MGQQPRVGVIHEQVNDSQGTVLIHLWKPDDVKTKSLARARYRASYVDDSAEVVQVLPTMLIETGFTFDTEGRLSKKGRVAMDKVMRHVNRGNAAQRADHAPGSMHKALSSKKIKANSKDEAASRRRRSKPISRAKGTSNQPVPAVQSTSDISARTATRVHHRYPLRSRSRSSAQV